MEHPACLVGKPHVRRCRRASELVTDAIASGRCTPQQTIPAAIARSGWQPGEPACEKQDVRELDMTIPTDHPGWQFARTVVKNLESHEAIVAAEIADVVGDDLLIRAEVWTVSLSRRRMDLYLIPPRRQLATRAGQRAAALQFTDRLREVQRRRHAVALARGKTSVAEARHSFEALDTDALLIDRVNALLLRNRSLDLRLLIQRHRAVAIETGDEDLVQCHSVMQSSGSAMIGIAPSCR